MPRLQDFAPEQDLHSDIDEHAAIEDAIMRHDDAFLNLDSQEE